MPILAEAAFFRAEKRESRLSGRKWPQASVAVRNAHNLPAEGGAWSNQPGNRMWGLPRLPRVLDVVDTSFCYFRSRNGSLPADQLVQNLWINVGQNVERLPVSKGLPTPATSTLYFSCEKDRLLSGAAHMQLLGWPVALCPREVFTESEYRTLAGNGFSIPIAMVLSTVMYCNALAPWWG